MVSRVKSWPQLVNSFKDIPPCFQESFQSALCKSKIFPYTIYVPIYSWNERETNEILLCLSDTELIILEKTKSNMQVMRYLLEDIILLNRGSMLLYSWIKIVGFITGEIKSITIEFNTVTEKLFEKLLAMIRLKYSSYGDSIDTNSLDTCSDISKLDSLGTLDYKFMNYAKGSLLPNERIHDFLFQPAISTKYLRYFNKALSKAHMHILAGYELIVIKEDYPNIRYFKTKKYLAAWNYIPLNRIQNVSIEEYQTDKYLKLNIQLPSEECLSSIFDSSSRNVLLSMISQMSLTKSSLLVDTDDTPFS